MINLGFRWALDIAFILHFETCSWMKITRSAFFQVAIHAIGDRANDLILDMYESVASANGERDRRFRVRTSDHQSITSRILDEQC